ncbi:hypothetical protein ACN4EK_19830 [Pantanalinema rosaneae CENA516]|uniref:hypothetical protein n=1 Tax=Pantanalinema rosaneae TaxID=1620701 RepID=UPI003D6E8EBC
MHRAATFLSQFLISLWVVLVGAFLVILLQNAPSASNTPFAGISIRTEQNTVIHLPNRIFSCTETAQQFQCQADLQNRLLEINATKGQGYQYDLSNCRVSYDGRSVGCQETGQTYAPMLSNLYEITNLGLSPQQTQTIQQEYWIRTALAQLGDRLLWISTGLALVAGIGAAFFTWLHPGHLSKGFASVACGFGMYQLMGGVLGRVPYDAVTPYGLTPDTWNRVVPAGAIAIGLITLITTALLLWRNLNLFTRILISLGSSAGIFSLCWWALMWNSNYVLHFLGLSNTLWVQQGYPLMWFSTAISIVLAFVAAILIGRYTHQSIKRFLCLGCGVGAIALTTNLLLFILLGLGYLD